MQRWKIGSLFAIGIILFVGFYFYTSVPKEEFCALADSIEATSMAFSHTMSNLEVVMEEGSLKLSELYEEDKRQVALKSIDQTNYFVDSKGIYRNRYSKSDSTGFATGYKPLTADLMETLMATESLNPYFDELMTRYPFVTQIYYNEARSFSRVYPSFVTDGMVEANHDITGYNFFEAASPESTESIFISTPYIDPAGKGWVISLIKPVIVNGERKGVFGVDLSVDMLNELLIVTSGMLIVNEEGVVLTLSEDMYQQAGLKVLKNHRYYSDVDKTISIPEEYNLNNSKIKGFRDMWTKISQEEIMIGEVEFDGKVRRYCANVIKDYGIYLLHINTK